jgi:uncharacterized protein YecE (DUF72 family)
LARIFVGTSGWSYPHWHGVLYPEGWGDPSRADALPRARLGHYLARFGTVELNSSYYRWPSDAAFRSWGRRLPPGFPLAVKAPGLLTHVRRLYAPEAWLARMERGLSLLGDRRGPLLVQLPPAQGFDHARLDYFLAHFRRVAAPGARIAVEFRQPEWSAREETFALLERHGAAYCVMSGAHLPCVLRATAPDFVYVRLHGPDPDHLYAGSYSEDDLRWWADRLREWAGGGRDVFAYFNNDGEGNAVRNAARLKELLGA